MAMPGAERYNTQFAEPEQALPCVGAPRSAATSSGSFDGLGRALRLSDRRLSDWKCASVSSSDGRLRCGTSQLRSSGGHLPTLSASALKLRAAKYCLPGTVRSHLVPDATRRYCQSSRQGKLVPTPGVLLSGDQKRRVFRAGWIASRSITGEHRFAELICPGRYVHTVAIADGRFQLWPYPQGSPIGPPRQRVTGCRGSFYQEVVLAPLSHSSR